MAEKYLIDTSAVIKYLNGTLPDQSVKFLDEILDENSILSFISVIELQVWNPTNPNDLNIYRMFI